MKPAKEKNYSFLAVADVHLGAKLFNLPELAEDIKEDFIRAINKAIELSVDYFFVVGDLFDTNRPSPDLIQFVSEQVKRLGANNCIAAGIAGDHDKPINNSTWIHLSKMIPINSLNDPRFVGFDYSDYSMGNIELLNNLENKKDVEWIFLHGQVPGLFRFVEEKKRLDLGSVDIINEFKSLKGIILGDIHFPNEGVIHDPKLERDPLPFIGYCGSLGMVNSKEIGYKKGILYYDGSELKRSPFNLTRKFIRLDISDSLTPINWVQNYYKFFKENSGKKPIIVVEYNKTSEHLLPQIQPLYDVAVVKTLVSQRIDSDVASEKEVINIRSELKTNSRIEKVLRGELPDKEVFELAFELLESDDPASVLDEFKERTL